MVAMKVAWLCCFDVTSPVSKAFRLFKDEQQTLMCWVLMSCLRKVMPHTDICGWNLQPKATCTDIACGCRSVCQYISKRHILVRTFFIFSRLSGYLCMFSNEQCWFPQFTKKCFSKSVHVSAMLDWFLETSLSLCFCEVPNDRKSF